MLERRVLRLLLAPLTMLLTLGLTTGVSSADSITTFSALVGQTFPGGQSFKITITDATWAQEGDVRLLEDNNPCTITDCSDVIRFVNVSTVATIFFRSDSGGSVDLTGVPPLPGGAFVQYSSEDTPAMRTVSTNLGNITATIRSDPGNPDDTIQLTATAVPEPSSLLLLGSGLAGLGLWARRRKKTV